MPDMPAVLDSQDVEFTIPAQEPNLGLREGEERFAAGMAVEHGRRRESEIAAVRDLLKQLEGTSANEMRTRFASSPSAKRRQVAVRKKLDELQKLTHRRGDQMVGPCAPATVINLNPDPLSLQGELQRWTVPPAGKGLKIDLNLRGRIFHGSYLTIATPHIYGAHTGTQNDKQSGLDMPSLEYLYVPPLGLVHQFYDHYVKGAADCQEMGGVLIFEGDIHTLQRAMKGDGEIWVPKKDITLDGYGDVVYTTERKRLIDCLDFVVDMQKKYVDKQIAEGHTFANSKMADMQGQLSNYHRLWHNFGLELGYLEAPLPWAMERLKDTPKRQVVHCPNCRQEQGHPEQYFCGNCNSAFDPLKAFLAGKNVPLADLHMYEGKEWAAIEAEVKRRRAKIALLEEPVHRQQPAAPTYTPPPPPNHSTATSEYLEQRRAAEEAEAIARAASAAGNGNAAAKSGKPGK